MLVFTMIVIMAVAVVSAFQLMQRFPRQVFGEDCIFLVGFVARRVGLKVKAESAGSLIFKLG